MQVKHQKDLRKGRCSLANQIYHITTATLNRNPVFNNLSTARKLISVLRQSDKLNFTNTLTFVVMPDHVHWLVQLKQGATLQHVVKI